MMGWLRSLLCRHEREAWAITYACGCRYEWCNCGAMHDEICSEHARFLGYTRQTIGTWRR